MEYLLIALAVIASFLLLLWVAHLVVKPIKSKVKEAYTDNLWCPICDKETEHLVKDRGFEESEILCGTCGLITFGFEEHMVHEND